MFFNTRSVAPRGSVNKLIKSLSMLPVFVSLLQAVTGDTTLWLLIKECADPAAEISLSPTGIHQTCHRLHSEILQLLSGIRHAFSEIRQYQYFFRHRTRYVTENAIELATLDLCSLALNLQKASLRRSSSTKAGFVGVASQREAKKGGKRNGVMRGATRRVVQVI